MPRIIDTREARLTYQGNNQNLYFNSLFAIGILSLHTIYTQIGNKP